MASFGVFLQFSIFVVIHANHNHGRNQVEAIPRDTLPVINVSRYQASHEKYDQPTDFTKMYYESIQWAPKRGSVIKKKKMFKKKKTRRSRHHNTTEEFVDKKKKRKKIKNVKIMKRANKKLVVSPKKHKVTNNSVVTYQNKRSQPVDIIVHIKMKEK